MKKWLKSLECINENFIGYPKCKYLWCYQYINFSNITIAIIYFFSVAPCKVIALFLFCLIFGVSSLLRFLFA